MTELCLSRICFGCEPLGGTDWGQVDFSEVARAIQRSLELGINFFDTADVYGLGSSEERLSHALGARRHDVTIATKGGVAWSEAANGSRASISRNSSPRYLRAAVEASLRRLRLDILPIYYVHWPDPATPIEATFSELEKLRGEGKIRSLGCSNYSAAQVAQACQAATVKFVQLPLNVLEGGLSPDMIEVCARHQLKVVAYNVLAQGLLSGKFDANTQFAHDDRRSRLPLFQGQRFKDALAASARVREQAIAVALTPAQFAIQWALRQPGVAAAIVGIKNRKQLEENAAVSSATLV